MALLKDGGNIKSVTVKNSCFLLYLDHKGWSKIRTRKHFNLVKTWGMCASLSKS